MFNKVLANSSRDVLKSMTNKELTAHYRMLSGQDGATKALRLIKAEGRRRKFKLN